MVEVAKIPAVPASKCEEELERKATATLFGSGLNLLKIIIGAAIISLPNIIFVFGYLLGPLILSIAGTASFIGLYLYLKCASYIGRTSSPSSLAASTLPLAGLILDVCIVLKSLGVSLSYVMIIGSIFSKLMLGVFHLSNEHLLADARLWMLLVGAFVLFPLSMLKTSKPLQFTSAFGIMAALYLVGLSVYGIWALPSPGGGEAATFWSIFARIPWAHPITLKNIGFFGTAVFAFSCHQIIFTLFNETRNNKMSPMSVMCGMVISTALMLYLIFSFTSLYSFLDKFETEKGTLLEWYPVDSVPYQLARLFYATLISFSYPLQVLPYRHSAKRLMMLFRKAEDSELATRFGLTLFFFLVTVGISLLQPPFVVVLSLVGSFSSSVICYILPAAFYLLMVRRGKITRTRFLYIVALLLGVFGVLVFLLCSFSSILLLLF